MAIQFNLGHSNPVTTDTQCLIVGVFEQGTLSPAAKQIDQASAGLITRLFDSGDLDGKLDNHLLLHILQGIQAPRVMLIGLGKPNSLKPAAFHRACLTAGKALAELPVRDASSHLAEIDVQGKDSSWKVRTLALAAAHQAYRYTATVKADDSKVHLESLSISADGKAEPGRVQASAIASGEAVARELADLPPNLCNPQYLAEQAQHFADSHDGVSLEVLERTDMEKLGMGALLAVAQGSATPPKLIVLQWQGAGKAKPYALVGKGVTFDSGGLNLKIHGGIEEMKYDMGGAAGVFGTFIAAVEMHLALNLVCVIPAVENMPDGGAYRPSDVITSMSGKTIEVLNTDAEGRLVLCDALTYTQRFEPQAVVDVATLTGACVTALGKHATGLMSKHDDLAKELLDAGEETLDRAWQLPLWDDYQKQLESGFADFANVGSREAGAITAGCFLSRFTEDQRWAHLDIAGTAWASGRKGKASGRPVQLLSQWLLTQSG